MAFTESLKVTVRKRSHLSCCLCHSIGVDVHHIVPQAEGGADTEDNAAALCPSCHETYGANPTKRKLIREARDLWYEICAKRFAEDSGQLSEIAAALRNLATKEDVERLAVRNNSFVLGGAKDTPPQFTGMGYSFVREEFVHPLIVRELLGWISDPLPTVVAVDLSSANRSNRFFGDFQISGDARKWVEWKSSEGEAFRYSHVATSPSGVQILECYNRSGGTGIFGSVGLFAFDCDRSLYTNIEGTTTRERVILKTLGSFSLGDRYFGEITYEDGLLMIGPDEGHFKKGSETCRSLPVQ
jgi:hypothetical protein